MADSRGLTTDRILTLGGAAGVALGAYLPWVAPSSIAAGPSGVGTAESILVPLSLAVVIATFVGGGVKTAALSTVVGALTAPVVLSHLVAYYEPIGATFAPAIGLYLTLFGGGILVVGGGIPLLSGNRFRETDRRRRPFSG